MKNKKLYVGLFWVLVGAVIVMLRLAGTTNDYAMLWIGYGWIGCGILQTVKGFRYARDEEYRKKYDTEANDERNRYLAMKAWAWAGYGFLLISSAAAVLAFAFNEDGIGMASAAALGVMIFLYLASYFVISRKN